MARVVAGINLNCFLKHVPIFGMTFEQKFWSRVDKTGECWEWTMCRAANGYGHVWDTRCDKQRTAHRVAYELAFGRIPRGKYVCHRCDNPACCRPDHLFAATAKENQADMRAKGRQKNPKGEQAPRAILTEVQVRQIKALYVPYRVTYNQLAKRFGVNPVTVGDVMRGATWKHV